MSHKTNEQRFWEKVNKTAGTDKCWLWTAYRDRNNYGQFRANSKTIYAHVYSWILTTGVIPEDKYVLHSCDNPPCVNPIHLFLGTQKENIQDCITKWRFIHGEKNGSAKLTDENVIEIIKRLNDGETQQAIADMYSVSQTIISDISLGVSWKHIARPSKTRIIRI